MPFTLAHATLAWPLRRHLPSDALVIGSLAPDFEYLVRWEPTGVYAHTFPGFLWLTTPAAILVLLGWRRLLRPRWRIRLGLAEGREPDPHVSLDLPALLLGILGHLLCDHFTHRGSDGMAALGIHTLGPLPVYKALQYAGSIFGLGACLVWAIRTLRRRHPTLACQGRFWGWLSWMIGGACLAGALNACRAEALRPQVALFATGWLDGLVLAMIGYTLWPVERRPSP